MDNGKMRLLLVEDDADDYYLTHELLTEIPGHKIDIDWAKDFDGALAAFKRCEHDVYILDYRLGKGDGIALLREATRLGCKAPIILLTGQGDRNLALHALEAGASDYLVKGQIDAVTLDRSIRYALQQKRYALELEEKVAERTAELERVNAELRESEEQFASIFNQTTGGIAQTDLTGRFVLVNDRYCQIVGRSREDLLQLRMQDITHAEDLAENVEKFHALVEGRTSSFVIEKRYARPDGSAVWVHNDVSTICDAEGKVRFIAASVADITERKAAELLLAAEKRVLELITSGAPLPQVLDTLMQETEAQSTAGMLCSLLLLDETGKKLLHGAAPSLPEAYNQKIHGLAIGPQVGSCGTAAFKRKPVFVTDISHDPLWAAFKELAAAHGLAACCSIPFFSSRNELLGTVAMYYRRPGEPGAHDRELIERASRLAGLAIERKRAEEALQENEKQIRTLLQTAEIARINAQEARMRAEAATRAKDDFLAALSHELRTPLNPALLLASSLAEDATLPERVREDVDVIAKSIALQAQLVDDLLDVTRISGGKLRLDLQPVEAHTALRRACEILGADIAERKINLTLDFVADRNCILADPVRVQQVFWNVLKNAVRFTPSGGKITVHTRNPAKNGDALEIEISDTGIGIEPAMLHKVFDAFTQEEHGAHRFGGIGLGLAITRRLVELQNGKISAESAGRDRGATFRIELPLAALEARAPDAPEKTARSVLPAVKPRRILLVEDHEQTRTTLVHLLERRGHKVASVASVAAARKTASSKKKCDLVISDLGLPDGDGNALMAELRDAYGLPGIALTGYGMEEDLEHSRKSGFFTHLTKPVDIHALEAAIAAAPLRATPVAT